MRFFAVVVVEERVVILSFPTFTFTKVIQNQPSKTTLNVPKKSFVICSFAAMKILRKEVHWQLMMIVIGVVARTEKATLN